MKFGGTSVGSTDRIDDVAKKIARHIRATKGRVVVVVSAMSGETDRLLELCRKVSGEKPDSREVDQVIASGEQVSCALTSLALQRQGISSRSLLAHHLGIRTRSVYGQNLIQHIEVDKLRELLDEEVTPVVAGFQGEDEKGNVRTLGRGGSDNTAVAIAAALDSCPCRIYTDIDGVYTALPQICKQARKLPALSYEEMLELASSGAKVLQARSVALARKFKVPLFVMSTFSESEGTAIVEGYKGMEDAVVSGITCRVDEAKFTVRGMPDRPGWGAKLFRALADAGVVVDMIVQSQGSGGKTTLSFTVPSENLAVAQETVQRLVNDEMPEGRLEVEKQTAKLSVVGEGMRTHAGVAARMFEVLGREGINIDMVTTSEIKITAAIPPKYAELAVRSLHEEFIEKNGFGR
jgi:aspartate kinase